MRLNGLDDRFCQASRETPSGVRQPGLVHGGASDAAPLRARRDRSEANMRMKRPVVIALVYVISADVTAAIVPTAGA